MISRLLLRFSDLNYQLSKDMERKVEDLKTQLTEVCDCCHIINVFSLPHQQRFLMVTLCLGGQLTSVFARRYTGLPRNTSLQWIFSSLDTLMISLRKRGLSKDNKHRGKREVFRLQTELRLRKPPFLLSGIVVFNIGRVLSFFLHFTILERKGFSCTCIEVSIVWLLPESQNAISVMWGKRKRRTELGTRF